MRKRITLSVRGRVQGVLFRDSARNFAQKLGVVGFVKNEPDGSVSIIAEGEQDDLEELMRWAESGPASAQVNRVIRKDTVVTNEFHTFEIIY